MHQRGSGARTGEGGVRHDVAFLTAEDLRLFEIGSHLRLYEKLGTHLISVDGTRGTHFAVWAPNADDVSVIGDFNDWQPGIHSLERAIEAGIWQGFAPGVSAGSLYKYRIVSKGAVEDKADPFAFRTEAPPANASVIYDLAYDWGDGAWIADRVSADGAPMSIYEMHIGSWLPIHPSGAWPNYRETADRLAGHVRDLGFTHVELMPVMEHPLYESWGYQITGFFAPTSRYGAPQDLMYLIDRLHRAGISVILDWVPFHFPADAYGLSKFDGTCLYEREGAHPRWTTQIFDYSKPQVSEFMLSNAFYWLDRYHADALRVDAVSSLAYPDYPGERDISPAKAKERLPRNEDGIAFLRRFNDEVHAAYPGVTTIAEDSLSMPAVTDSTSAGGLGFDMKWGVGWLHDTVDAYMTAEPADRSELQGRLTLPMLDLNRHNVVLSLSHDEVQPGKGSLLGKMPGDEAHKFANVRLFLAYMFAYPGKKLLFMGSEFAQVSEWTVDSPIDWSLREKPPHAGVERLVRDLNRIYADEPAMRDLDFGDSGFVGINCDDAAQSTISFLRRSRSGAEIAVICNFSANLHDGYSIGVPRLGPWRAILNTDSQEYGGAGRGGPGELLAVPTPADGQPCSLELALPPLTALYLKPGEAV